MTPQTNKLSIDPRASTSPKIVLLSPSIDGSYTTSRSKVSVTPDETTVAQKVETDIRKEAKTVFGVTYYDHI